MHIKMISFDFFVINKLEMLKKESPIFLQNINMIACQLFLLFKKSTTFWDNPRIWKQTDKRRIKESYEDILTEDVFLGNRALKSRATPYL